MNALRLVCALALTAGCEPSHPVAPTGESVLSRLRPTVTCGTTLNATAIIEGAPFSAPVHAQVLVTEPADARFVVLRSGDGTDSTLRVSATKLTPGDRELTPFQSSSLIGILLGRPVIVPHASQNALIVSANEGHATIMVQGDSMRQELEVVPFEDLLMTKSVRVWEGEELLYEAHFSDPKAPDGCNEFVPRTIEIAIGKELNVKLKYVQVRWMQE